MLLCGPLEAGGGGWTAAVGCFRPEALMMDTVLWDEAEAVS